MSKKQNKKFITPEILRGAVKGAFVKLNPRYMMKNPVMFVVEIGFFITLLLSFFPGLFGDVDAASLRIYDIIVCVILFITVLFANFAEAIAEARGKAQADSLMQLLSDVFQAREQTTKDFILQHPKSFAACQLAGDLLLYTYPELDEIHSQMDTLAYAYSSSY